MNTAEKKTLCPFGEQYQQYWDLLSPAEQRMKFDRYGLFALTPRKFSEPILRRIQGQRIVDACCSVGGMSIALAEIGKEVVAVELDPERCALAKQNAELFGVAERIRVIQGDVLEVLPTLTADTVFFDGQWGISGVDSGIFKLSNFLPDGKKLLDICFSLTDSVVLRVPANFYFSDFAQFSRKYDREETKVDGRIVAYSVYFGHS